MPAVAAGELLDRWFPSPAKRFAAERGPLFGGFFWSRFVASFLSPFCAAGSVALLLWIARALGAAPMDALIATGACVVATQFWPGASETMSNVPGALFLIATVAAVTGYAMGVAGRVSLFVAGLTSGAAILVRYPQLVPLVPIWTWAVIAAWRRARIRDLAWLILGGLPGLVLLLWANHARFGAWTETGYTENAGFFSYPFPLGFASILASPGKGLLWLSPLFWIVLWSLRKRTVWGAGTPAVFAAFVLPLCLFSTVSYWAAGQCFGIRYLTAPLVVLCLFVLVRAMPWRRTPRTFAAVVALGGLVALGGVLAPYTGQQALAYRAAEVVYGPQENLDNNVNWSVRLSPVHSDWIYAFQALRGRLGSGHSADTTEALFGVRVEDPVTLAVTDTGFRHFWWRALTHYWIGFPGAIVAIAWSLLTALAVRLAWRRWHRR